MHRSSRQSESGYILLAVLFMLVLILIALAVAAPRVAADIQRDREAELIHRGKQYTRAIKLYYKKFGRYPSSIDQLENTNNIRFLRKRYVDPMTGKDDWKIIHFGEAHVKAMGLFGKPIQNGGLSTTAGGSVLGGAPGGTGNPLGGGTSSFGGTTPSAGGMSGSLYAPTPSTDTSGTGDTTSTGTTSGFGSTTGTTSGFGSSTGTTSGFGTGTGTTAGGGATTTSGFGGGGQTLGGAPMVGVVSKNTKASIKEYKLQKHYNEWEFVYDPVEDMLSSVSLIGGGGGASGGGLNGPGTPGRENNPGSPTTPFSGPGSNSGFSGSSPTSPQNPTTPPTSPQ